jgi:hypothetical protein
LNRRGLHPNQRFVWLLLRTGGDRRFADEGPRQRRRDKCGSTRACAHARRRCRPSRTRRGPGGRRTRRERSGRCDGLSLAARSGDVHHIGGLVDHNGVVSVVVDDVVRRRRDIFGRTHPDRDRHIIRTRKNECIGRRRGRRQVDEIRRSRRQEDDRRRRRRCKVEIGIVERQYRALNINYFIRRWRRHVVGDHRKSRRGLESRR